MFRSLVVVAVASVTFIGSTAFLLTVTPGQLERAIPSWVVPRPIQSAAIDAAQVGVEASQQFLVSVTLPSTQRWHLASGYGLFRRMTGVGEPAVDAWGHPVTTVARPELVIEGWWPVSQTDQHG
jgi:hypothetical protein